jgi:hypothetical protein
MNPDETPIEIIELPPSQPTRGIPIDDPLRIPIDDPLPS